MGEIERNSCEPVCLVEGWGVDQTTFDHDPFLTTTAAIEELRSRGISTDVLSPDVAVDQFASLTACSPQQNSLFRRELKRLNLQVNAIPTERIVEKLEQLYEQAYGYDETTREMDVVNISAKRELDLWIAAIERAAFEDPDFLQRIKIPEVEKILALNSPDLLPYDRGVFYRMERGLSNYMELTEEGLLLEFTWLRSYTGHGNWIQDPYWKSRFAVGLAMEATFGKENLREWGRDFFPHGKFEEFVVRNGFVDLYGQLSSLSDEELTTRVQDLGQLSQASQSPWARDNLVDEIVLGGWIIGSRGIDLESAAIEMQIKQLMDFGHFSREDAELFVRQSGVRWSSSRLDDYQARFQLLDKFKEIYREFLTAPLEERFSPERSDRYNLWSQLILNRAVTGIPLSLDDIETARAEVRQSLTQTPLHPFSWQELERRGGEEPLWIRPEELGISSDPSDPLSFMDQLPVDGGSLRKFTEENVDFIATFPDGNMPDSHALGIAYLLFGAVVLQGSDISATGQNRWTPGRFAEVLAHEAGHNLWARKNFDEHSERLAWRAATERLSYIYGAQTDASYLGSGFASPRENADVGNAMLYSMNAVRAANIKLGLSYNDFGEKFSDPRWEGAGPQFFAFNPPDLLTSQRGGLLPMNLYAAMLSRWSVNSDWNRLVEEKGQFLGLTAEEKRAVLSTTAELDRLGWGEISPTLMDSDPLVKILNQGQTRGGLSPMTHITLLGKSWQEMKRMLVASFLLEEQALRGARREWQRSEERWPELIEERASSLGFTTDERRILLEAVTSLDGLHRDERSPEFTADHPLTRLINEELRSLDAPQERKFQFGGELAWLQMKLFLMRNYNSRASCIPHHSPAGPTPPSAEG